MSVDQLEPNVSDIPAYKPQHRWLRFLLPAGAIVVLSLLNILLLTARPVSNDPPVLPQTTKTNEFAATITIPSNTNNVPTVALPTPAKADLGGATTTPIPLTVTPNLQGTLNIIVARTETAMVAPVMGQTIMIPKATTTLALSVFDTPSATSFPKASLAPSMTLTPSLISLANPPVQSIIAPGNAGQLTERLSASVGSQAIDLAFSPDGRQLGVGSASVAIYDTQTLTKIRDIGNDSRMAFNSDWSVLATVQGKGIRLWNPSIGGEIGVIDVMTDIQGIAISPDGKAIAAASGKTVKIIDEGSYRIVKTLPVDTFMEVSSVAFSPDGRIIASGDDDGTVSLWDATNGHALATLSGHTEAIRAMTFAPNGTTLISASDDGTIRLWSLPLK